MVNYECKLCNFKTHLKTDFKRHLNTLKHGRNLEQMKTNPLERAKKSQKEPKRAKKSQKEPKMTQKNLLLIANLLVIIVDRNLKHLLINAVMNYIDVRKSNILERVQPFKKTEI